MVTDTPKEDFQHWITKKPKRADRLEQWFSQKQVNVLGRYYSNTVGWVQQLGQKTVLIDSSAIQNRAKELESFYKGLGYLDAQVDYSIDSTALKKAEVTYQIQTDKQYYISQYKTQIDSKELDSLYYISTNKPLIRAGQPFEPGLLELERKRLIQFFRDNGVYNFQSPSLRYQAAIDSLGLDAGIDLTLKVSNLQIRANDTLITREYKTYPIKSIALYRSGKPNSLYQSSYSQDSIEIFTQGNSAINLEHSSEDCL